ncbi:MAG: GntP family permease [Clostridia bacterium]|nr:GntP family permease [Clostridia bacterium]
MSILGILLSLALLIYVAYRGFSVILFAPVMALIAAALSGLDLLPTYTELFMPKMVAYAKNFFPVFMLGAVFGKVMDDTGAARSIAHAIIEKLGKERAILAVVLACAILTYGGVSLFVVAFAVYPFAAALFREADIPKRLIPGSIALGSFTFTMTALPGSPQIQNLIPTKYFGTNGYAAPIVGLIAGIFMFGFGLWWLERRRKAALAAGEGYGTGHKNEPEGMNLGDLPNFWLSLLPLVAVLGINYWLTKYIPTWDPSILKAYNIPLKSVVGIWAIIVALVTGIILAIALNFKQMKGRIAKALNEGTVGSLLAIMNTASEVGYGNVISSLPGFKAIAAGLMSIKGTPLISEAIIVNVLAGITGSASGGMSIALETMSKQYLDLARQVNLNPELLHRIASISSGGFDTLPHNGAVITLLAICGLTHKQSYADVGVVSLVGPVLATIVAIIMTTLFRLV